MAKRRGNALDGLQAHLEAKGLVVSVRTAKPIVGHARGCKLPSGTESPDLEFLVRELVTFGHPQPKREYRFHPVRKWRFDVAWPDPEIKVALEREGGTFQPVHCPQCNHRKVVFVSRHHSRKGLEADAEKYNAGLAMGWRIYRATPGMLKNGSLVQLLRDALQGTNVG